MGAAMNHSKIGTAILAAIALGVWANVATALYTRATISRQLDDLSFASSSLGAISKTVDRIEDRDVSDLKDSLRDIRDGVRSVALSLCDQDAERNYSGRDRGFFLKECSDQFLDHPLPPLNLKPN